MFAWPLAITDTPLNSSTRQQGLFTPFVGEGVITPTDSDTPNVQVDLGVFGALIPQKLVAHNPFPKTSV